MNLIIFDKPNHVIQFKTPTSWVDKLFLCPVFLEPSGVGEKLKIAAIRYLGSRGKLENYQEIDMFPQHGVKNIRDTKESLLGPEFYYGLTIIDCAKKEMVSLTHDNQVNGVSWISVEILLNPKIDINYTKPILQNYLSLLELEYIGNTQDNELLAKRIKKYLKTQKTVSGSNFRNKTQFLVSETLTGWKTHWSKNYADIENYKKLYNLLLDNGIVLSKAQQEVWQEFSNYQTRHALTLDFFEEQKVLHEQQKLNRAVQKVENIQYQNIESIDTIDNSANNGTQDSLDTTQNSKTFKI